MSVALHQYAPGIRDLNCQARVKGVKHFEQRGRGTAVLAQQVTGGKGPARSEAKLPPVRTGFC